MLGNQNRMFKEALTLKSTFKTSLNDRDICDVLLVVFCLPQRV